MVHSRFLNLGCGLRSHPDWTNVDMVAWDDRIIRHDLRVPLPFADASFDCIYHSHVLEHFNRADGENFIRECFRVLSDSGVMRVCVPDFECVAREYLNILKRAGDNDVGWSEDHQLIILELLDQASRDVSGGELAAYLLSERVPNKDYAISRFGMDAERMFEMSESKPNGLLEAEATKSIAMKWICNMAQLCRYPKLIAEVVKKRMLGNEYNALKCGRFRLSGEVHRWAYDRYSLSAVLKRVGFSDVSVVSAQESSISDWQRYNFDVDSKGNEYHPHSLFIEARK